MKQFIINTLSILILLIFLSPQSVVAQSADLNGDGKVDVGDYLLFLEQFGKSKGDPGFIEAQLDTLIIRETVIDTFIVTEIITVVDTV